MKAMPKALQITAVLTLAAGVSVGASAARAAPQVLGLVASLRPTPMLCDVQGCRADLSAFCLQQPRSDPPPGTVYHPAPGTRLTLVVTGPDGATRRLDAAPYLSFVDNRGFVSITALLKPADLARLGAAAVAVEVGLDATLLPDAQVGDASPQSADELALATGAYRNKAETYFDRPGRNSDAIRLTNAMINEIPAGSRSRSDTDGHLLARTLDDYRGAPVDPAGVSLAEGIHQSCVTKADFTHQVDSMRSCLEGSHDILSTHTNIDFWNSLGGS
jgi:hypothetical protein